MTFEMPLPPHVGNARGHWRTQKRARDFYWETLDILVMCKAMPKPPAKPMRRVRASATFYLWSAMDDDNCMARTKHAVDWLRWRKYIANDTKKNIEWAGLPAQHIDRQNTRLVLTIEPYEAGPTPGETK